MKDIVNTVIPAAVLAFAFNCILSLVQNRFDEKNKLIEKCSYYNRELFDLNKDYRRMAYGITDVKVLNNQITSVPDIINKYSNSSLSVIKLDIEKDKHFFHLLKKYNVSVEYFNKWLKSSSNELDFDANIEAGKTLLADMQTQAQRNKIIVLWQRVVASFVNKSSR